MRSTWLMRSLRVPAVVAFVGATVVTAAVAKPSPNRPSRPRAQRLFAAAGYLFQVNQQQCGLDNFGEVCVAFSGSPVGGGGFWPKGTPDQYIFNSGLQIAGVIPDTAGGGSGVFPWAGDTVGAFFFDARGDQGAGEGLTLVYSRLNPSDVAAWPNGAMVRDPALYHPQLLGQPAVSQGDVWMRYWEGNPVFATGRTHPMGIAVDERVLAWNYPPGNQDIIYILYTFYNVTAASSSGKYNNATIPAAIQSEIADIGDQFQALQKQKYKLTLPTDGYTLTSVFAAEGMDADVAVFSQNYATAFIPFNLGTIYTGTFLPDAGWVFPTDIFISPFASAPGFIGAKFLKSPTGLAMFSMTVNSAVTFPDPFGVNELYRYLSGRLEGSGRVCSPYVNPVEARAKKICFLNQAQSDSRFFQSSGPFSLAPGQASSIVVAYINAAPVKTTDLVNATGGNPGLQPGVPGQPDSLALAPATYVRPIDKIAGWLSANDANGDGVIQQDEVTSVPKSLLDKAIKAQAVFDNGFLLPFAPEAPNFYLIPGNNQVTIVWQKSASEATGDPFYFIANHRYDINPVTGDSTLNRLFNPNFRHFDVEGYRIYRGRTSSALTLVAQFDYSGTTFVDYTGEVNYGNCAPELGVQTDCPVTFDTLAFTTSNEVPITGDLIQVPPGGRVQLLSGDILVLTPDSTVENQLCGDVHCPKLDDSGVGFGFVDTDVRNSFTYFYAVTAFDVNSVKSGPSSLESPRVTKPVIPRKPATTVTQAKLVTAVLGGDGTVLDPSAGYPSIDTATGTFSGNMPPANDGTLSLVAGAELLPQGDIVVRIDSVLPGFVDGFGPPGPNLYLKVLAGGDSASKVIPLPESAFSSGAFQSWDFGQAGEAIVPYDSTRARLFGVKLANTRLPISFGAQTIPLRQTSVGSALAVGRYNVGSASNREISRYLAHSRWFDEGGQEPPDPTIVGYPDTSHNAGKLTNVGRIWAPQDYRDRVSDPNSNADAAGPKGAMNLTFRRYSAGAATTWYPGDFVVTWNADSSISVFDATHHSNLPLAPNGGTGFGFVNLRAFSGFPASYFTDSITDGTGTVTTTALTYHYIYATAPACVLGAANGPITCIQLERKAQFEPIDFDFNGTPDGNGIALMINGEAFIMEMNAIPATGTKWHLRAVTGSMTATCVPALGPVMRDCSAYTFTGASVRPSLAPGLTYKVTVQSQYQVDSTKAGNLSRVHTVPDPYYVASALEITANQKILKFVNLPPRAIIRIYSVSGVLVSVVIHDDPAGGGEATWNLRNRNNQFVASGVYFYHVEAPDGSTKIGRFTVVNFAP